MLRVIQQAHYCQMNENDNIGVEFPTSVLFALQNTEKHFMVG